jgi:hypothetical protein
MHVNYSVIPGRGESREPGIHDIFRREWIPGSSLRDAPE